MYEKDAFNKKYRDVVKTFYKDGEPETENSAGLEKVLLGVLEQIEDSSPASNRWKVGFILVQKILKIINLIKGNDGSEEKDDNEVVVETIRAEPDPGNCWSYWIASYYELKLEVGPVEEEVFPEI